MALLLTTMAACTKKILNIVCRHLTTTCVHRRCLTSLSNPKVCEITASMVTNRSQNIRSTRNISLNSTLFNFDPLVATRFQRIMRVLGKLEHGEHKMKVSGMLMYTKCADQVNYNDFIKFCNLSDTFYSWFLVTELHVWMCMVRLMNEGDEGRVVRNALVGAFWKDTDARAAKLGKIASTKRRKDIAELNEKFLAAIFTYDEGLVGDDKILAGALWRQLLQCECDKTAILEGMVHYVRRQTLHLESYSRESLLLDGGCVSWTPLPEQLDLM